MKRFIISFYQKMFMVIFFTLLLGSHSVWSMGAAPEVPNPPPPVEEPPPPPIEEPTPQPEIPEIANWKLVWNDEFDYSGLPDSSKWGYDYCNDGCGNNEWQYYTENRLENTRVENGRLVITAIKENYGNKGYTSARLISKNKGDWLYGKLEIRAKLPRGRGTWPAIWMLPTDWEYGGWPNSGEIDIMEHVGYDQGRIHGTVHTGAYNHMKNTQKGESKNSDSVSDEFHTYGIEWSPEKIDFFMDGELYFTFHNEYNTSAEWPFDKRFYLLMNIAVGGDWGGAQGVDPNIWPQTLEVDYVRVYEEDDTNNGERHTVPGQIEAEAFNSMSGIQTENCSEGGMNVGWIGNGDWIEYNVNILEAGEYKVEYRVAGWENTAELQFRLDNQVLRSNRIPNTGNYQNWETISDTLNLSAGEHTIRLLATGSGWNINWFKLTANTDDPVCDENNPEACDNQNDCEYSGNNWCDNACQSASCDNDYEGYYKIVARHSGKCLDVSGHSTANGGNIKQWSYVGGQNQQWSIEEDGSGYYKIIARESGKCLDVEETSMENGGNIHQWSYVGGQNQQWSIEEVGEGYYRIVARHSGKCLDVEETSNSDGANVHQWSYVGGQNQQWKIEKVGTGDDDDDVTPSGPLTANKSRGEWTLVTIPDTQHYSQNRGNAPTWRMQQAFDWLVSKKDQLNIKLVQGLGDITESWDNGWEWDNSASAWNKLYGQIPFMPTLGNHDSPWMMNQYFPVSNFSDEPWWGDDFGGIENNYLLFTIGNEDYLFLHVECYDQYSEYRSAGIEWAKGVLASNPDKKVILATHALTGTDHINNQLLYRYDNIVMANGGHDCIREKNYTTNGPNGGLSHNFVTDYQCDGDEVMLLRYYKFKPLEDIVEFYTYSPITGQFENDWNSQGAFSLIQADPDIQ